jgi:parallel beta-helix repeat protein
VVADNVLENTATVQDDTSLLVGAIACNSRHVAIVGNVIRTSGKAGIVFEGNSPIGSPAHTTVSGNTIQDTPTRPGIFVQGGSSAIVVGNTITHASGGIATDSTPVAGLAIVGNTIAQTTQNSLGINLMNASQSLIADNVVTSTGGQGIVIQAGTRDVVKGNIVQDSGQAAPGGYPGIQISTTHTLVTGNHSFSSGSGTSRQSYGILEGAPGNYNDITGNDVYNNQAGIATVGAATTRAMNRLTQDLRQGQAMLGANGQPPGQAAVMTAEVQTGDNILLTRVLGSGTLGHLSVGTITNGTSFAIISSDPSDRSTVFWMIVH